ncbi:hypothetical protein [Haladaptatus sp. DJG-WS-42]|uniref:hypothetical protein n=1 Tax=Haladaptatus sp. DJG-WS-42 TaxID=3120516 RepID=UPI0030CF0849
MTRFAADTADGRQALFVDAIAAHEHRESPFLTIEAEAVGEKPSPWVQFATGTLNLDCTAAELDRLKSLLTDYPAYKIDDLTRPEEADGTNVRIEARTDPERVAEFIDVAFCTVYDQSGDYTAWVTQI